MTISGFRSLTAWLAAALLAGCGVSQPQLGAGDSIKQNARAQGNIRVLHTFHGGPDGKAPRSTLLAVKGVLYGTTAHGGAHTNEGTVFSIDNSGREQVLHSFGVRLDGAKPGAGLIDAGGTLYGTTYAGGSHGTGTIFSITPSGSEQVLHSFGSGSDGTYPAASLINVNGTLYGTTIYGGAHDAGIVFTISTAGKERALHSFGSGTDGVGPRASLIDVNGTLYGTTFNGGANCSSSGGCGTVFTITPSGAETVLHSFGSDVDGAYPTAALIDVNGTLYGATAGGGEYGGGTLFSINVSGDEQVLYSFGSGNDGRSPRATLLDVQGTLYGMTTFGGTNNLGTIFSFTASGRERVVYNFKRSDGGVPYASLIAVNNELLGTAEAGGGRNGSGGGTVFALSL